MKSKKNHTKLKRYSHRASWLFAVLTVSLFVGGVALRAVPKSWAAEVTMEVYQQKDGKIFGTETVLDVFDNPKLGGKKLVAPFTKGTYTFAVHNNSDSKVLPYTLNIKSENPHNIPLVFNIEKNGDFLFGGEGLSNMLLFTELDLPESLLAGNLVDLYTLNWEWKTENDVIDTAIGNDGTQLYKLFITAVGTAEEIEPIIPTETPLVPTTEPTAEPTSTPIESGQATERPEPTEEPESTEAPETPASTEPIATVEPEGTPAATNAVGELEQTDDSEQEDEDSQTENSQDEDSQTESEASRDSDYENSDFESIEETIETKDIPPTPTKETSMLVLQSDGSYLELDAYGVPLGSWRFNEAQNKWIFEEIGADSARTASIKELPQTGLSRRPIYILSVFGTIILLTGFIMIVGKKRKNN